MNRSLEWVQVSLETRRELHRWDTAFGTAGSDMGFDSPQSYPVSERIAVWKETRLRRILSQEAVKKHVRSKARKTQTLFSETFRTFQDVGNDPTPYANHSRLGCVRCLPQFFTVFPEDPLLNLQLSS